MKTLLGFELTSFRHPLLNFVILMEEKLMENDFKTGWEGMTEKKILKRLRQETEEIQRAIDTGKSKEEIALECADVANFAMMLADNILRNSEPDNGS